MKKVTQVKPTIENLLKDHRIIKHYSDREEMATTDWLRENVNTKHIQKLLRGNDVELDTKYAGGTTHITLSRVQVSMPTIPKEINVKALHKRLVELQIEAGKEPAHYNQIVKVFRSNQINTNKSYEAYMPEIAIALRDIADDIYDTEIVQGLE